LPLKEPAKEVFLEELYKIQHHERVLSHLKMGQWCESKKVEGGGGEGKGGGGVFLISSASPCFFNFFALVPLFVWPECKKALSNSPLSLGFYWNTSTQSGSYTVSQSIYQKVGVDK